MNTALTEVTGKLRACPTHARGVEDRRRRRVGQTPEACRTSSQLVKGSPAFDSALIPIARRKRAAIISASRFADTYFAAVNFFAPQITITSYSATPFCTPPIDVEIAVTSRG